jgi:hypothetical protein
MSGQMTRLDEQNSQIEFTLSSQAGENLKDHDTLAAILECRPLRRKARSREASLVQLAGTPFHGVFHAARI